VLLRVEALPPSPDPSRVELSFFFPGKKGKQGGGGNRTQSASDEVAWMVHCVLVDEEVDTLNLDRWMWVSKEIEEITSNLDSPF